MGEKRFKKMDTIIDPFPIWDTVEEKGYNCTDTLDVLVDLLNEQQSTIEYLTKSRDKWRELSNSFLFYCKCYEKAIERAFEEKPCPSEEDINRIYEELEKELDNECELDDE